jgi:predicted dienelactone hydrolase
MTRGLIASLLASSLVSFAANAEGLATKDMPIRVELHPLQTLTLSDQQFLAGDKAGAKATTLAGQLSIAQGAGRLPVVILMHGSGGAGGNIGYW